MVDWENKEEVKQYHRDYFEKNKKRLLKLMKEWDSNNPIKRKERYKRYNKKHPHRAVKWKREKYKEIYAKGCYCCPFQNPVIKGKSYFILEKHHKIPKAKGGTDSHTNQIALCPVCHRLIETYKFTPDELRSLMAYRE